MSIIFITSITKRNLNNSSYIGALVLATAGKKPRLLLAHIEQIIRARLINIVYIAVFGSNPKLLYIFLQAI